MSSSKRPKTTPALKRANAELKESMTALRECDLEALQQEVGQSRLPADHQSALMKLLTSLHQVVKAEALRDSGGQQQDMFSGLKDRDFAAWKRSMNGQTLF